MPGVRAVTFTKFVNGLLLGLKLFFESFPRLWLMALDLQPVDRESDARQASRRTVMVKGVVEEESMN